MDALGLANALARPAPLERATPQSPLRVRWARHLDEVRRAQRLRYRVFAQELGAHLPVHDHSLTGLDIDRFDDHCEHLLVTTCGPDDTAEEVIGTYRVLLPQAARRAGGYYTESEFDLERLLPIRSTMAELGRSCIAPAWRTGGVIMMLWTHLARFLVSNKAQGAIGCVSVGMADGGRNAARLWRELRQSHLTEEPLRVVPHLSLPVDQLDGGESAAEWPPLLKGYVRCGARLLGAPAWDPDFGMADFPMLLDLSQMPTAYRRRLIDSGDPQG